MKQARSLYLISPPGAWRDGAVASLGLPHDRIFDGVSPFLPLASREPGVVVILPAALPAEDVLSALLACAEGGPGWIPALVPPGGKGDEAVTMGPGYAYPLAELARSSAGESGSFVLSLPEVIERVRVARHDINNPLAAALAETQLLRMDAEGEGLVEALGAIEEQLRRIRELVASLHGLRPPSRGAGSSAPARMPGSDA